MPSEPDADAAIVEAMARAMDAYANPYSKHSNTRWALYSNRARAALVAIRAAGWAVVPREASVEMRKAEDDAAHFGCGFLILLPGGAMKRVDASRIIIKAEARDGDAR